MPAEVKPVSPAKVAKPSSPTKTPVSDKKGVSVSPLFKKDPKSEQTAASSQVSTTT